MDMNKTLIAFEDELDDLDPETAAKLDKCVDDMLNVDLKPDLRLDSKPDLRLDSKPTWESKYRHRVLFTNITEIQGLKRSKESNLYEKPNFIPEQGVKHPTHPVCYVLFVGKVERMKSISDMERQFYVIDETAERILVIEYINEEEKSDYQEKHKIFRDMEKELETKDAPTQEDEYALNVAQARWLLARRRKEITVSPKGGPEEFVKKKVMFLGSVSELGKQRVVYAQKILLLNKEQEDWIKKNRNVDGFYEKELSAGSLS